MTSASDRVQVIAPGQTYVGKQGFTCGAGASMETVGAERICMNVLPVPVGGRAKVHYHQGIETIAYLLEGECAVYYGERLERRRAVRAGEQIYIPADVPHVRLRAERRDVQHHAQRHAQRSRARTSVVEFQSFDQRAAQPASRAQGRA
jgi:uncharacterized RmlC-like cupin family protein